MPTWGPSLLVLRLSGTPSVSYVEDACIVHESSRVCGPSSAQNMVLRLLPSIPWHMAIALVNFGSGRRFMATLADYGGLEHARMHITHIYPMKSYRLLVKFYSRAAGPETTSLQ